MILLTLVLYILIGMLIYYIIPNCRYKLFIWVMLICLFIYLYTIPLRNSHIYGKLFTKITNNYELYSSFTHGDVVFSSNNSINIFTFMNANKGLHHVGIIKEENGIKYMYHSIPNIENKYAIKKYSYLGLNWVIAKEPLLAYIIHNNECFYQIFRPPLYLPKIKFNNKIIKYSSKYCSELVSNILHYNGIIPTSTSLVFTYRPYELIEELIKKKYKCFYIHSVSK